VRVSRVFFVAAVVISFVGIGATGAVAWYPLSSRYHVASWIAVHLIDGGGARPGQHCVLQGSTSQTVDVTATGTPTQLGAGRPRFDYPRNRGPFRDPAGTPVLFACGDTVSVCFHPSTVVVDLWGEMTATVDVALFEGSGLVAACDPANEVGRRTVSLSAVGRGHPCAAPVMLTAPRGSSVTIESFCMSLRWVSGGPDTMDISGLDCFSFGGRFSCAVMLTGAAAPLAIRWRVDGTDVPAFDDQPSVTGRCPASMVRRVEVVVLDALSNVARTLARVQCY
jgi:hypothetical protein